MFAAGKCGMNFETIAATADLKFLRLLNGGLTSSRLEGALD